VNGDYIKNHYLGVPVGLDGASYRLNLIIRNLEKLQGVGIVTAASFLEEISDISNYDDNKQIQKIIGVNLKETSSGMKNENK